MGEKAVISRPRVVVYTTIAGVFPDKLRPPLEQKHDDVDFICFSDVALTAPAPWQLRPLQFIHPQSRRASRFHKLLAPQVLPGYDYSLWLDGSHQLTVDVYWFVEKYLKDHDLATFKHPQRDCIYQESRACIKFRKDDQRVINKQMSRYRREQFPQHVGLVETSVLLRRHNPIIEQLGVQWWNELQQGSLRDQLSFNYVVHKLKIPYGIITGELRASPYCRYYPHR